MKSILFSLYQHFRTLSFRDALTDVLHASWGIVRALCSRSKDDEALRSGRMACCEECEFFDETWQTCGTPGETMVGPISDTRRGRIKIGCWCYLPLANRDPKKDCYARVHDLRSGDEVIGWPDELRPR